MTKSEQTLAVAFGVLLLAGGGFVGLTQLKAWKQRVDVKAAELARRQADERDLLAEQAKWDERSAWLMEKQPVYTKRSDADLMLLNLIQDTASSHSVKTDLQPQEPSERLGMTSSTMVVQAQGELGAVLKWLHALQEPTAFISIPTLTMLPNEEDTKQVIVNMTVQKWFRLPPA